MDIMNVYVCNLPEEVQKEVVIKLINYYYLGVDKKSVSMRDALDERMLGKET